MRLILTITMAAALVAGAAAAEDKPVAHLAVELEAAGVHSAIGVGVDPEPVLAGVAQAGPLLIDERTVVSPDDPPAPAKQPGKVAGKKPAKKAGK